MPYIVKNDAEMGTNATAVTTANSGGGGSTAWTTVNTSGTATITFSNAQAANGSLSYMLTPGAISNTSLNWNVSSPKTIYLSTMLYCSGAASTISALMNSQDALGSTCASTGITSTAKLAIYDSAGAALATSTSTIPANQWVRIESKYVCGAGTTGFVEARLYLNADASTPNEVINGFGNTTAGPMANIFFSIDANGSQTVYLDDLTMRFDAYPDPPYVANVNWLRF